MYAKFYGGPYDGYVQYVELETRELLLEAEIPMDRAVQSAISGEIGIESLGDVKRLAVYRLECDDGCDVCAYRFDRYKPVKNGRQYREWCDSVVRSWKMIHNQP